MRFTPIALALSCVLTVAVAPAAARQTGPAPQAEEAEHEALRQLRGLYEQAIREGRLDLIAPHIASDFFGVMVTGRVVKSMDDIRAYWQDIRRLIGEGGTYTTTLNPELSVILGDVALARGTTSDVVVTSEHREYRFTSYWTAALQKENGVWKIRQLQGSMDPVDNAFVRDFGRRGMLLAAAVGGLIGLALGGALGLVATRRRKARRT